MTFNPADLSNLPQSPPPLTPPQVAAHGHQHTRKHGTMSTPPTWLRGSTLAAQPAGNTAHPTPMQASIAETSGGSGNMVDMVTASADMHFQHQHHHYQPSTFSTLTSTAALVASDPLTPASTSTPSYPSAGLRLIMAPQQRVVANATSVTAKAARGGMSDNFGASTMPASMDYVPPPTSTTLGGDHRSRLQSSSSVDTVSSSICGSSSWSWSVNRASGRHGSIRVRQHGRHLLHPVRLPRVSAPARGG